ncbi:MAG: hypothetical protein NVS9B4_00950 [Candidatus Acidiferrum sp.]
MSFYHTVDKWKPEFKERQAKTGKLYRDSHKEEQRLRTRADYDKNKEKYYALARARLAKNYASNPELRAKANEYYREYFKTHRAEMYAQTKAWNKKNPEKRAAICRKWEKANLDKVHAYRKAWTKANPEKVRAKKQNRSAADRGAEGKITAAEWAILLKYYKHACACCGAKGKLTLDHIVAVTKGGSNTIDNAQPLCLACNSAKGNRHTTDYKTRQQRLPLQPKKGDD